MRRTIADELKEEGAKEGALKKSQQTLIRLMKRRFGDLPDGLSSAIRTTNDPEQLDEWLDRFATAETLEDVEIGGPA